MPITAHRWALYAEVIRRETRRLLLRRAPPEHRRARLVRVEQPFRLLCQRQHLLDDPPFADRGSRTSRSIYETSCADTISIARGTPRMIGLAGPSPRLVSYRLFVIMNLMKA